MDANTDYTLLEEIMKNEDDPSSNDIWVKEFRGEFESLTPTLITGSSSHVVALQSGEILPTSMWRDRSGIWFGEEGHISGMKISFDGKSASSIIKKYVRGLGYLKRDYGIAKRVDYIVQQRDVYSIFISAEDCTECRIEFKLHHGFAWPDKRIGTNFSVSLGDLIKVGSDLMTTNFTVSTDGIFEKSWDPEINSLKLIARKFKLFKVSVSNSSLVEEKQDLRRTIDHHRSICKNAELLSPDWKLNKIFLWAKHDLLEFFIRNGSDEGWFAGFPVYSWYFDRDACWVGLSANIIGMHDMTKKHLLLLKENSINGRIPHEITVSAGGDQKFRLGTEEVSSKYWSIDGSLMWLLCYYSYRIWSGDHSLDEFSEEVFRFLKSCDLDNDNLLENSFKEGLVGWPETWSELRDGACVDVNAWWIEVLRYRRELLGKEDYPVPLERYMKTFFSGGFTDHLNKGEKINLKNAMRIVPTMYFNDEVMKRELLNFSDTDSLTPWGLRSMSSSEKMYNGGYHTGTVWPLMTGWMCLGAYNNNLESLGLQLLETFVKNAFLSVDPGRVNETYGAEYWKETGQFAQLWSTSLIIQCVFEGIFGIKLSSLMKEDFTSREFKSNLPSEWDRVELKNILIRGSAYDIKSLNGKTRIVKCQTPIPNQGKQNLDGIS